MKNHIEAAKNHMISPDEAMPLSPGGILIRNPSLAESAIWATTIPLRLGVEENALQPVETHMPPRTRKRARPEPAECPQDVIPVTGFEHALSGTAALLGDGLKYLLGLEPAPGGGWVGYSDYALYRVSAAGEATFLAGDPDKGGDDDGVGPDARFGDVNSLALSPDGGIVFVADWVNDSIRRVDVATGTVSTLAYMSDGPAGLNAVAVSPDGHTLYVSDEGAHRIHRVEVASGVVSTLAGGEPGCADGIGSSARFDNPAGVALTRDGASLFVADEGNHRIRKIDVASGTVSTLAESSSSLSNPHSPILSPDGSTLYVCCSGDVVYYDLNRLRSIDVASGNIQVLTVPPVLTDSDEVKLHATLISRGVSGDLLVKCKDATGEERWHSFVPPLPPITIPASTFAVDMRSARGDEELPHGPVSFIVGPEQRRLDHVCKSILAVRSEYFSLMFRGSMVESEADTVTVPDASLEAFTTLIDYLLCDTFEVDTSTGHAFEVMELADKYQVPRLKALCQQAIQASLGPANVVPLLEACNPSKHSQLLNECRYYIAEHGIKVLESGGIEALQQLRVAKGLLTDAIRQAASMIFLDVPEDSSSSGSYVRRKHRKK